MSATIPSQRLPADAAGRRPVIDRADQRRSAPPRPRTASPWPWSPPGPPRLAPGETVTWQDGPRFAATAIRLYHVRAVVIYGVVLTLADIVQAKLKGLTLWPALEAAIPGALTTAGALGILAALAWCSARTTRYTLTSHRLVMQCGLALPRTIGIPLGQIESVAVRVRADGTGDVTMRPKPGARLMYLKLWPFARPWHYRRPEPMLRDVPGAGYVGTVLSRAIAVVAERASQQAR